MAYETSYDTGLKPFNHDKHRGKWSSPRDFFFTCLGHAFKIDGIMICPSQLVQIIGVLGIIPYSIIMATCVIPIVFLQSFLGQFSSTGFISVFRIAPLFKGIGYVSLAINLTTLTYFSSLAAIPLFYFVHSLRPILPWSCEGAKEWMQHKANLTSPCYENITAEKFIIKEVPSIEFMRHKLNLFSPPGGVLPEGRLSWLLMIFSLLLWVMVGVVLSRSIEVIGRFIRYSCLAVIGIMCICLIRFAFLPGALLGLGNSFFPKSLLNLNPRLWIAIPGVALGILGPGWGSILTMASYNNFKTNIFRYSWLLCLSQFGITIGIGLMMTFISSFLQRADIDRISSLYYQSQWVEFLVTPTALTFLEVPHFWTLMFFGMLILGALNLLIVQLFSVLTSLFDEYEKLRTMKREFTLGTVIFLALISIFFCSNLGLIYSEFLRQFSMITQMILNLMLLLTVLWIYGRERFQRDVNFMNSRTYPSWMVNIIRYVAPIFLLASLMLALDEYILAVDSISYYVSIFIVTTLVPWCLVPGYCIFKLMQTSGMFRIRFRRCSRPADWYPVDPVYRQQYEENFSNSEISQQLTSPVLEPE